MKFSHVLQMITLIALMLASTAQAEALIAEAFPRHTMMYVESTIEEAYRQDIREGIDELNRLTQSSIDEFLEKLPEMVNQEVGTQMTLEEMKKIFGGLDQMAYGLTSLNLAAKDEPHKMADWLLVMQHRHVDTLQGILNGAIKRGSRYIVGRAEHGAAKITNIEIPIPNPSQEGTELLYRIQIAVLRNWVVVGNRESTLLDALDHLNGEALEDTLPKNSIFKAALGGVDAESRGFINMAELFHALGKVKEVNDAIDEYELRTIRALSFHGKTDYAARSSKASYSVLLDEEIKPSWFKAISKGRTANTLANLVKKPTFKLWAGNEYASNHREEVANLLKKMPVNTEDPAGREFLEQILDREPREFAFYLLSKGPSAPEDKSDSKAPEGEAEIKIPEGLVAFKFGKAIDDEFIELCSARILDKAKEDARRNGEPFDEIKAKVLTELPDGFKGRSWLGGLTPIYVVWNSNLLLIANRNDFAEVCAAAKAASEAKQDRMIEMTFNMKAYMDLLLDVVPQKEMAQASAFFDLLDMDITMSGGMTERSMAINVEVTNIPRMKDVVGAFADVILQSQAKRSMGNMQAIREIVMLGRASSATGEYPASLHELVEADWLTKENLVDPSDKREESKNSYTYFQAPKDALRNGAYLVIAQEVAGWTFPDKRIVILLNGEFRKLDDAQYAAALALAKEGKPLPEVTDSEYIAPLAEEGESKD